MRELLIDSLRRAKQCDLYSSVTFLFLRSTMGCLQATECIKMLLGRPAEEITSGRVIVYDALKLKFGEVGLAKQPDREIVNELIDYQGFCAGSKALTKSTISQPSIVDSITTRGNSDGSMKRTLDEDEVMGVGSPDSFHSIPPRECLEKLSSGWTPWVIDVRLQTEHEIVALPFTDEVVPHRTVRAEHIPKSGDVLVYCKAGARGKKACNRLIGLGVKPERLFNLDGGVMRWQSDVDPALPRY